MSWEQSLRSNPTTPGARVTTQQDRGGSAAERRRERRLAEIAEAARKLFASGGYTGTSMAEVANALDLSPKALYYYYPSKRAILDAVLERGFVEFEVAGLAVARDGWRDLALREVLVESSLQALERVVRRADLLRLSFSETFRGNPVTRARHEKYMRNWTEHVEMLIGERAPSHALRPEHRAAWAEAIVETLFGLAVDFVLRERDHTSTQRDDHPEWHRVANALADAVVDAAGASLIPS